MSSDNKSNRLNIIRIILIITFLALIYPTYIITEKLIINNFTVNQSIEAKRHISIAKTILDQSLHSAKNDIDYLNNLLESSDTNVLESEYEPYFTFFAITHPYVTEVIYLDMNGIEKVRVNKEQGQTNTVDEADLQDQSNMYYISETLKLGENDTYFSHFNLNVENQFVEVPINPVIQVGKLIYIDNVPTGILIVNYSMKSIFQAITEITSENPIDLEILNMESYWLKSHESYKEWSFTFDDTSSIKFSLEYPDIWNQILDSESDIIITVNHWTVYEKYSFNNNDIELILVESLTYEQVAQLIKKTLNLSALLISITFLTLALITLLITWYLKERSRYDKELLRNALYDTLTQIPNRLYFSRHLHDLIQKNNPEESNVFALFFIDLDGFKSINDDFGHDIGDRVLIDVANRLKHQIRRTDSVYRLGGDEFTVIITDIKENESLDIIANKIIESLSHHYVYNEIVCHISVSIGISIYPKDASSSDELIKIADDLMYEAKRSGKHKYKSSLQRMD